MTKVPNYLWTIKGLIDCQVNVDELVSLAIIASIIQGGFLAAALVCFVMTIWELIEQVTSESARKAIKSLIRISTGPMSFYCILKLRSACIY